MIVEDAPDPLQQLQLIDAMINKARNRFSENGHLYLLWGWTVLICSTGSYVLEYVFFVRNPWIIWLLIWVVVIYQFIYIARIKKSSKIVTYTGDLVKYVWQAFSILCVLMVIIVTQISNKPHQTDAVFLVMYGMPTFLSGNILKFKPLVTGAFCCWLLAIISIFIPLQYHMLLIAVAVIIAWIVPGYLLRVRFKTENNLV